MKNLLLHPETAKQINRVIEYMPHAVLLSGNLSSGKKTIATNIAERILGKALENYPYYINIKPEKNTLTINQIRDLKEFTKLKTTGTGKIRRIAILEDAHLMNNEAQNALLKLLEEPPDDTLIILTVVGQRSLKPTIYSRAQQIVIKPVQITKAIEYADSIGKSTHAEKSYALSQGDAGLYIALLHNDDNHPLAAAIANAKKLLTSDTYSRLIQVDSISKDKDAMSMLIFAMKRIASAALHGAIKKDDSELQKRWLMNLDSIHQTENINRLNANSKLLLTDLFLQL